MICLDRLIDYTIYSTNIEDVACQAEISKTLGFYLKFHEFGGCQPSCEKDEWKKGDKQHDVGHFFCMKPKSEKYPSESSTDPTSDTPYKAVDFLVCLKPC